MKKTFAILAVAMMMFTTGCGKTAEDVKQDANAAVEQVKEKADEVKEEANAAVNTAANDVQSMIDDAKSAMAKIKDGTGEKTMVAIDGIVPGINFETVTEIYGEPISYENQIAQFSNGVDMKVVNDVVQEVSTMYDGIYTPGNVAVGMVETALNETYGKAGSVTTNDNGGTVYKYVSSDNTRAIEFVTRDGVISEIKCTLNK